jgi:hypothetical protein
MPGDYSRQTFNPGKHYSGVRMQQGRVLVDAEKNEAEEIQQYRTLTEAKDVIGACGAPKQDAGFQISISTGGTDLTISEGRFYVDGLLCELDKTDVATTYFHQPYYPNPDATYFISSTPESPPASPPTGSTASTGLLNLKDGRYLVYLDAWQREINFRDDPYIQEVALGEADTTTRLQTVWQVKLLDVTTVAEVTCRTPLDWASHLAPGTGKLNAQTKRNDSNPNPCLLPPRAGYRRLENQLYRVEVHKGGAREEATFKWSRDNATVETIIEEIDGTTLTVRDVGKDLVLGFAVGQCVEVVSEESILNSSPYPLRQINGIDPATRKITLNASVSPTNNPPLKLRRWDQAAATAEGLAMTADWIDLEDGIQVKFSAGIYRACDYWLIPARTATADIEWPPYQNPNPNPIEQLPAGIDHHYCRLALIHAQEGHVTLEDCRKLFPPLTGICAEDTCFDNRSCNLLEATTVQQALEELCNNRENVCTLVAVPGPGWERVFDKISAGHDAQICFQVGQYILTNKVIIPGKGHLQLSGCGPGTKLIAATAEATLVFDACNTVTIRDMYAETGLVGSQKGGPTQHLNGTFTFLNCNSVTVEDVGLKCGSGGLPAAACLSVRNDAQNPGTVRIRNCDLSMGHQQHGLLLINIGRALIENNTLKVYAKNALLSLPVLVQDKKQRAGMASLLVSYAKPGEAAPAGGITNVRLTAANHTVHFKTHPMLKGTWPDLLAAMPPPQVSTPKELLDHVNKITGRILTDAAFRNQFPPLITLFNSLVEQDQAVACRGITIGGRTAEDIRILNNTIQGTLQGIHLGLSHEQSEEARDLAESITIAGNSIQVLLPPTIGKQERHGIFVGNCQSLLLENNYIQLKRLLHGENILIDGIRVWGVLGDRLMITKNHIASADGMPERSFHFGINVHPVLSKTPQAQWVIMWNVAPSKQGTVTVVNGAVALDGTNTP